jgi:hypothetical protein
MNGSINSHNSSGNNSMLMAASTNSEDALARQSGRQGISDANSRKSLVIRQQDIFGAWGRGLLTEAF